MYTLFIMNIPYEHWKTKFRNIEMHHNNINNNIVSSSTVMHNTTIE